MIAKNKTTKNRMTKERDAVNRPATVNAQAAQAAPAGAGVSAGARARMLVMASAIVLISALAYMPNAFGGQFFERNGVAIDGFDPVAYFTDSKPVRGDKSFTANYLDSTFHFASAKNRDMFKADPARYAPQYNGYCAYGVAHGAKAKIEGERFAVVDGKLYLNYDADIQASWQKDVPGFIQRANKEWAGLK
ncbi:MAG: YHS domain-containing (seleno)protein [Burkholderiaceae bacterium]